jgi:hypothetical protein
MSSPGIAKAIITAIVMNAYGVFMVGNFDRYHGGFFVLALVVGYTTRYSVVVTPHMFTSVLYLYHT